MNPQMPSASPHTVTRARRIAIVVVTYNSAEVLDACLRSLPAGAEGVTLTDVVIADNGSSDDWERIAAASPVPVTTVQLGRNAGYAAGFDAGLTRLDLADLDAVYLLNPDCRLRPGSLATLAAALEEPHRGIAAPRLLNPDGTLQPTLRRMPTVGRAFAEMVLGGQRAGRIGKLGELVFDPAEHERPGPAAWVTGAAMLISTRCLADVGPWDESFLLYSEETEFILRAADAGWTTWYEPAAVVEHIGGESDTNPRLAALAVVNKVRLFSRRRGQPAAAAYYALTLVGQAVRALTGRATARAAVVALLRPPSRRPRTLAEL
jgi:GT2 family glycosyltransferase